MGAVVSNPAVSQRELWNRQHCERAVNVEDCDLPTQFGKRVASLLCPPDRLLEFGCAAGRDTLHFATVARSVLGCDFSESALTILMSSATRKGLADRVQVKCYDLNEQFRNDTGEPFSVVYTRCSLHVDDETARRLIADISVNLVPGGLLCAEVKSVTDPLFGLGDEVFRNGFVLPDTQGRGHLRRFWSVEELSMLMKDHFRIVASGTTTEFHLGKETHLVHVIAVLRPFAAAPTGHSASENVL